MAIEDKIPRFNHMCGGRDLFTEKYEGKVIQLEIDGEPYLRFGRGKTHPNILIDLLDECSSAGDPLVSEQEHLRIITSPRIPKSCGRYKLVGAGLFSTDPDRKQIEVFGVSTSFQIRIDPIHMEKMKPYLPKEFTYAVR